MDPLVGLVPQVCGSSTFDVWGVAGHKSLQHDGTRLLLTSETLHKRTRVHLCDDLHHAMPFGYLVPALSRDAMSRLLDRVAASLSQHVLASSGSAQARPSHNAVVHMRALQAYDGICAGASHRQVAAVLFGEDLVARKWEPDSELRAHVRYLIRRARFLVNLGYTTLLSSRSSREGAAAPLANAP
jgi:hypothetical protein